MATLVLLCSLALLATSVESFEKQPALDATNVDLYQQLLGRVEHLEKRDQDQQAEIDTLRSELYAEKQRTTILEEVIASLRSRDNETSNDGEKVTSDGLPSYEFRRDSEEKPGRQSSRIFRRQADMPVIAFHATLKNTHPHTGEQQTVAFDNVITNIGGAYNPHFGSFIAPVPGVYVFYTKILEYGNQLLHVNIVKNGAMVAQLYLRDQEGVYDHDSAMVVLHLAKGDDVAVQSLDSDKLIEGYNYSMFSGFLLHEDVSTATIVGK